MDAATAAFIASCKEKEGATKKLPTIFKYNGDGKEVFVCGNTFNYCILIIFFLIILLFTSTYNRHTFNYFSHQAHSIIGKS